MVLEHAVGLVAIEVGEWFSILSPCDGTCALEGIVVGPSSFVAVFNKFVLEIGEVATDTEVEVAGVELPHGLHFNTRVLHLSYVADGFRLADIRRDVHFHEHAVGGLLVVVNGEGKGIVEESEVETEVELFALLPFQVGVGQSAGFHARCVGIASEDVVVARGGHHSVAEVTDVLITVLSP